jgi:hypothetical protein
VAAAGQRAADLGAHGRFLLERTETLGEASELSGDLTAHLRRCVRSPHTVGEVTRRVEELAGL